MVWEMLALIVVVLVLVLALVVAIPISVLVVPAREEEVLPILVLPVGLEVLAVMT